MNPGVDPMLLQADKTTLTLISPNAGMTISAGTLAAYGESDAYYQDMRAQRAEIAQMQEAAQQWAAANTATGVGANGTTGDPNVPGPGFFQAGTFTKEAGFFLRHPIIAWEVGKADINDNDISTVARRFSTMGDSPTSEGELLFLRRNNPGNTVDVAGMGDEVNAFRHTLWQATIANRYGNSIAAQVGNAHEENPWALNSNQSSFSTLDEADQAIDLLNNRIGRSLGPTLPQGTGMATMANVVLDTYYKTGLWSATQAKSGAWVISQSTLSQQKYELMKTSLAFKDDNGNWIQSKP
jgi:hypothetical protein